jgi:hypothetical protein
MASSAAGSNFDGFFPVGTPENRIARFKAAVTAADDMLRRGRENAGALPSALKWMEVTRTPIVTMKLPWFEHLIACGIYGDVYLEN